MKSDPPSTTQQLAGIKFEAAKTIAKTRSLISVLTALVKSEPRHAEILSEGIVLLDRATDQLYAALNRLQRAHSRIAKADDEAVTAVIHRAQI